MRAQVTIGDAPDTECLVEHTVERADVRAPDIGADDVEGLVHGLDQLLHLIRETRTEVAVQHPDDLHRQECRE